MRAGRRPGRDAPADRGVPLNRTEQRRRTDPVLVAGILVFIIQAIAVAWLVQSNLNAARKYDRLKNEACIFETSPNVVTATDSQAKLKAARFLFRVGCDTHEPSS